MNTNTNIQTNFWKYQYEEKPISHNNPLKKIKCIFNFANLSYKFFFYLVKVCKILSYTNIFGFHIYDTYHIFGLATTGKFKYRNIKVTKINQIWI